METGILQEFIPGVSWEPRFRTEAGEVRILNCTYGSLKSVGATLLTSTGSAPCAWIHS